jgi:hypothetical protein
MAGTAGYTQNFITNKVVRIFIETRETTFL